MYTRRTKLMKGIGEWGRGERGGEMTRNEREKGPEVRTIKGRLHYKQSRHKARNQN